MNIFSEIPYSFAGVKQYPEFLKNKTGRVVGYVFLLVFIYFIIAQMRTIPNTVDTVSSIQEMLDSCADFEMDSGRLYISEPFYFDAMGVYLSIDTTYGTYINEYDTWEWEESFEDYEAAIVLDSTTALIVDEGEAQIFEYPKEFSFTKNDIYGLLGIAYIVVLLYLVFAYVFSVAGYFIGVLLVALVGMIANSDSVCKLSFKQIFILAVYAKTLPLLIKGILQLGQIGTFFYSIIGFAIGCVFIVMAIRHINRLAIARNSENYNGGYGW